MRPRVLPGEWPLVLSTSCFLNEPVSEVLQPVTEAGFDSIEIASSMTHFDYHSSQAVSVLEKKLKEMDIKVNSLHAPYKDFVDLTQVDETGRQKAVEEVLSSARALSILGGKTLVVHGGSEEQQIPEEDVYERLKQARKSLLQIQQYCQKLEIMLAVEDMLGHLLGGKLEHLHWLISQLPEDSTGVCLDTGHSFLTGRLTERVRFLGPRLVMSHVHDNGGVLDDHLPPGEGKLPWPLFFKTLREVRFEGPLVLEIRAGADIRASIDSAVRGARFIRKEIARRQ